MRSTVFSLSGSFVCIEGEIGSHYPRLALNLLCLQELHLILCLSLPSTRLQVWAAWPRFNLILKPIISTFVSEICVKTLHTPHFPHGYVVSHVASEWVIRISGTLGTVCVTGSWKAPSHMVTFLVLVAQVCHNHSCVAVCGPSYTCFRKEF